jgi:hypothetical protein
MYERKSRGATACLREGRIHVPIAAQLLTTETPPELGQALAAVAEPPHKRRMNMRPMTRTAGHALLPLSFALRKAATPRCGQSVAAHELELSAKSRHIARTWKMLQTRRWATPFRIGSGQHLWPPLQRHSIQADTEPLLMITTARLKIDLSQLAPLLLGAMSHHANLWVVL